jgi:hypothetical protein
MEMTGYEIGVVRHVGHNHLQVWLAVQGSWVSISLDHLRGAWQDTKHQFLPQCYKPHCIALVEEMHNWQG